MPEPTRIEREARKIIVENSGKQPCGSTALPCMPREKGGRGRRSIEEKYEVSKATKIKVAVKSYGNSDPALAMVGVF